MALRRPRRFSDLHGRGQEAQSAPAGVRPGGAGSGRGHLRLHRGQGGLPLRADPAPHRRARPGGQLPRVLGGRQRQRPRPARLSHPEQQRDRPLQGRHPLPPERQRERAQVPRLRADLQERADRPAHGRRQGRRELQSQGQVRARDHALLPELHDRALPPHRRRRRRAGGRHRRRRARDRLHVRPVQAHHQPVHRGADRQGPRIRRLDDPARGDRATARSISSTTCSSTKAATSPGCARSSRARATSRRTRPRS